MLVRGAAVLALLASLIAGVPAVAAPEGTADLAVTAVAGGPAIPGQPLTWTVTATNHGPAAAENVTLTQTVPVGPGETVVSAVSTVGPCTVQPPGTVACDLGELDIDATVTVTVGQSLSADRTEAPATSAIIEAATPDTGTADNTAAATATLHPVADLWLTGAVSALDPLLGGAPVISVQLTDLGPGTVPAGTRATVTLPAPVGFAAAGSSPGCTAAARVVTCTLAKPLGVGTGSAVTLSVRGTPVPAGPLPYAVAAQVPAEVTDPDADNNKATLASPVVTDADVGVTAAGPTDAVAAGTTASVTWTVTNHGPAVAAGVRTTATLPAGLHLDSSANGCTVTGQTVTCPPIPSLPVGQSVALVVTLAVDPGQAPGAVVVPVQIAVGTPHDPDDSNRTGYLPLAIVRQANLALNTSRTEGTLNAGEPVSYQLTVHNFGPGTAAGVTVTDRLPAEISAGTATVPGGTCTAAGQLHTCTLSAALPVDTSVTMTVTGTVSPSVAGDTITDTGFASSGDPDLDATDNGAASTGIVEGALTPAAHQVAADSGVHRVVARLTWWIWAGVGTVLVGMVLLAVALRHNARIRVDR